MSGHEKAALGGVCASVVEAVVTGRRKIPLDRRVIGRYLSSMKTNNMRPNRIQVLDVFRGTAILAVIILHVGAYSAPFTETWAWPVISRLSVGVQLFFVLSGYLITKSWSSLETSEHGLLTYAVRRVAKIYPLYLIFMALGAALWALLFLATGEPQPIKNSTRPEDFTFGSILAHATFFQGIAPHGLHAFVDGSWSIICEVYFYALFPLVIAPMVRTSLTAAITLIVSLLLSGLAIRYIPWGYFDVSGWSYYNFLSQMPCFIVGCLAFRLDQELPPLPRRAILLITSAASALMVTLIWVTVPILPYHHAYALALGILIVAVLNARITTANRLPLAGILAKMGQQSYALFLIHIPLLGAAAFIMSALGVTDMAVQLSVLGVIGLPVSLCLSDKVINRWDALFVEQGNLWLKRRSVGQANLVSR